MGSIRPTLQWAIALCASLTLALVLDRVAVPASFLVGPMLIGIFCALAGATIRLPRSAFMAGQALIGCLIARAITAALLGSVRARASKYSLCSRTDDDVLSRSFQDGQHGRSPPEVEQSLAIGGYVLVGAGARAEDVAQFIVSATEPGG